MLHVFRSNHHCSWNFHIFHRKTYVSFLLKMMKLKIFVLHAAVIFLLIDWLKNTIDIFLFYGEHFSGFSERDFWKFWKKKHIHFTTNIYIYGPQPFWSFMKFYFIYIVKVCFVFKKQSCFMILCICVKRSQH